MEGWLDTFASVAALVIFVWLGQLLFGGWVKKYQAGIVTVTAHEGGVRYRKGVLTDILGPGRYTTWPAPETITRVDLRLSSVTISGQEILTEDKLSVRVSVLVAYRVNDLRRYVSETQVPVTRLYEDVQIALRARVASKTLDDLLADRSVLGESFVADLAESSARLGLKLDSVAVRDITLAGPAKQAFADMWKAQKEGLAALERARGEQAALRALNNAARLLKGNPELMNLRLLQTLAGAPGKTPPTLVLGGAVGWAPVSKDAAPDQPGDDPA